MNLKQLQSKTDSLADLKCECCQKHSLYWIWLLFRPENIQRPHAGCYFLWTAQHQHSTWWNYDENAIRYSRIVSYCLILANATGRKIIAATLKHLKIFMQTGFICCFSESIMSSHSVSFEYAIELICCAKAWWSGDDVDKICALHWFWSVVVQAHHHIH